MPSPDRSYTTRVIVAVVIAAVIGFVAPMVATFVPMFSMLASGGLIRIPNTSSLTVYDGSLYWTTIMPRGVLWKHDKATDEVQDVAKLSASSSLLQGVGTDRELWLFGPDSAQRFDGKLLDPPIPYPSQYFQYQPFVYRSQPAYLQPYPTRMELTSFDGRGWLALGDIGCDCTLVSERNIRAVGSGDTLHLLVIETGNVRHRSVRLGEHAGDPTSWTLVARDATRIEAAPLGPDSFVLAAGHDLSRGKYEVEIHRFEAGKFTSLANAPLPSTARVWNLAVDPASKSALLAYPGGLGADLSAFEVDATGKTRDRRISHGMSFFTLIFGVQGLTVALGLVVSLVLSLLLTRWMRKEKGDDYRFEDRTVELATLSRRGLAQIIDTGFQTLPFVSVVVMLVAGVFQFESLMTSPTGALYIISFSIGSMVWAFGLLGVWSVLEARRGKTLGKWLCGIRTVGENLEPCGFARALVRNLLEYGDGMFMFSIGMAVTALTEKRQRLGDILAKTIVIRDR